MGQRIPCALHLTASDGKAGIEAVLARPLRPTLMLRRAYCAPFDKALQGGQAANKHYLQTWPIPRPS